MYGDSKCSGPRDFLCSVCWLLVTANVVPSSPILVTLMMEALYSSEMSDLTGAIWRNIPEDGILYLIMFIEEFYIYKAFKQI
jgi:hypothetical protein